MILNERQYLITQKQVRKFEVALDELSRSPPPTSENERLRLEIHGDALRSQLEEMREEVAEYENLKAGKIKQLNVKHLEDLPDALIQARIARGLTQEQLAVLLGVKAQQVQRDEANKYASSSLQKILAVSQALNLDLVGTIII
jgi:DNA-binding XRE family transcriptional regulator